MQVATFTDIPAPLELADDQVEAARRRVTAAATSAADADLLLTMLGINPQEQP